MQMYIIAVKCSKPQNETCILSLNTTSNTKNNLSLWEDIIAKLTRDSNPDVIMKRKQY